MLEDLAAQLENGSTGVAFASGLAAIDAVLKLLEAGDEIIAVEDIYGGAFRQFTHIYAKFGISVKYVDTTNVFNIIDAITPKTKLLWIETPTNPTLKITDLKAAAKIAANAGILLCVDNTFASPVLQKPLDLGADIVIHSATKYLGGHSDLISGLVVTKDPELGARIKFIQNATGAILSPFDSWLVIRGIETLHLRVEQHCRSAQAVAEYLKTLSLVNQVYYPGLSTHLNHGIAKAQMKGFGGVVTFDLVKDDAALASAIVSQFKYFKLAESLGGVKSLCCQPCEMTHKSIPREKRYQSGVTDSLIRLSVGIENSDDLIQDLDTTFKRVEQSIKNSTSIL